MPSHFGMGRSIIIKFGVPALSFFLLFSFKAYAVTSTQNISLSANVSSSCRITAVTNVLFTAYDPLSKTDNDTGVGSFSYKCTKSVVHWLYITGVRQMTGIDVLNFELYKEPARVTPFEAAKTGGGTVAPNNDQQAVSLYGRIPAKQNVKPGIYSTVLVINVEY